MNELNPEVLKKKHKEFDQDIENYLKEVKGETPSNPFEALRIAARRMIGKGNGRKGA